MVDHGQHPFRADHIQRNKTERNGNKSIVASLKSFEIDKNQLLVIVMMDVNN